MNAPERPLPASHFYSVEFPGYVSLDSVDTAISKLGGQSTLDNAFRRRQSKSDSSVELRFRPDNPFAHPIPGDVVLTTNILLKVVKRRRKQREGVTHVPGEYTVEAVGIVPKTLRFRNMADFQYEPDMEDPMVKLRSAMDNMDVEAICSYRMPKEKGEYRIPNAVIDPQLASSSSSSIASVEPTYRSNLRLLPPPVFTRQLVSQSYNYKTNPASVESVVVDPETGEEHKRLINRLRWKGYGPATMVFTDNAVISSLCRENKPEYTSQVPTKPPQIVQEARSDVHQSILKRLEELFAERPVWTRASLFNQFNALEAREIHNSKILLPLVCYVFSDGPWRDTLLRFGYDPRQSQESRRYQRLYFRNVNHPIVRPSLFTRRQDRSTENAQIRAASQWNEDDEERRRSHIFDGKTLTRETAAFQLCDITDPMLKAMIDDPTQVRDECHERDGWYTAQAFDNIKTVMRHKFFSLLEGHVATDEECLRLLESEGNGHGRTMATTRPAKLRSGKHNMAKGAQRPEDAAAERLRAALEKNVKGKGSES